MENTLPRVGTGVKDGSIPIQAAFGGDLVCRQEKVSGDGRAIACPAAFSVCKVGINKTWVGA